MPTQDYTLRIIIKALNQASGPLKQTAGQLDKIGKTATRVGGVMTAAITLPLVAAGTAGVKMATDLDESMRNIQSVGRQTEEELAGLSKTFVDMSMNADITRDSAQNLAEAFFTIQGSGFAGEEAMLVLEAATKAASAGMTETEVAAEALAGVINSYGLAAEDASGISDLLFRTVDRGVGSFEELSGATGRVVGTASQAGVSFEEVSAALATMSKQGISFTEGSTALNQVLLGFIKPSEAMESAIQGLGFASGQAMLDELGLAGSIKALEDAGHGGTEAMSALFGNVRALKGALALTGAGAEIFAEDLEAMADATGTTAEAFEIQMQSFAAQMAVFKNTLNAALIEVGQVIVPILTDLLNALLPVLKAFANAPQFVQTAVVAFAALLAVIGPILLIVGQLATALGAIGGVSGLTAAFASVAGVITGTVLPALGTVAAAIAGVGAVAVVGLIAALVALIAVFVRWRGEASLAERAFETIKTIIRGVHDVVFALGVRLGEFLRGAGKQAIQSLAIGMAEGAIQAIIAAQRIAQGVVAVVKNAFRIGSPSREMMDVGQQVMAGFFEGLKSGEDAESAMADRFSGLVGIVENTIAPATVALQRFGVNVGAVQESLVAFAEGGIESVDAMFERVQAVFQAVGDAFSNFNQNIQQATAQAVQRIGAAANVRMQLAAQTVGKASDIAFAQRQLQQMAALQQRRAQQRGEFLQRNQEIIQATAGRQQLGALLRGQAAEGRGGTNINVGGITVQGATGTEAAREIASELARQAQRRGVSQS